MSAIELNALSAWRLRELLLGRTVSPVEVVEACLARIDALEPRLHSFITVAPERALADAGLAEAAIAKGAAGPLCGVPVALKDELWTEGIHSTDGSLLYRGFLPDADGVVAARLRRAGAIVVGKTNMPEFATFSRSLNRLVPESRNPWDPSRTSGASSGGSAAAVAAGMVPLAIGSDGGGSTRIPASLCGVVGLYPTAGRVPSRGSFNYSIMGSVGPLTRDVRDAALVLQAIAGPEAGDPFSSSEPAPDYLASLEEGVHGLRAALLLSFDHVVARPGIAAKVVAAATRLEQAGMAVSQKDVSLPDVWDGWLAVRNGDVLYAGAPAAFTQTEEFRMHVARPDNRDLLCEYNLDRETTRLITHEQWKQGRRTLSTVRALLGRLFEDHDVLLTPTMPDVAPVIQAGWGTLYPDKYSGTYFALIVNFARYTAASYPCGLFECLPVGLQVIGRPGDEATVLRVGRALERAHPWQPLPTSEPQTPEQGDPHEAA